MFPIPVIDFEANYRTNYLSILKSQWNRFFAVILI